MLKIFILQVFCAVAHSLTYDTVTDLSWTISNNNGTISVPCQPPQGVYTSLLVNGVLSDGDFYYRYNDRNYRWVSKDDWIFTTEISASPEILQEQRVVLEFEGLDTAAHINIDGSEIGFVDNMFSRSIFDVKGVLEGSDSHELSIVFESPVEYAETVFNKWLATYGYPILPECVDVNFKGECHPNIIRKMQASFSWDWGPAFPDSGIWKPWNLVGWSSLKVHDILFDARTETTFPEIPDYNLQPEWSVTVQAWLDLSTTIGIINGNVVIELDGTQYVSESVSFDLAQEEIDEDFQAIEFETTFIVPQGSVSLWWPNGYGSQPLYDLTVTWISDSGETSSKTVRVGFRTVELDQSLVNEEIPENGRNFFFRINNVEIFMKGSNWIPAHVIPDQVTPSYTRQLLQDAANTYQNCMRVWGGGIYETDVFYEIADELGIFIWEDMMFACSMYAANDEFIPSVIKETKTQIRRLQHHPSILLWAGNNENELALKDNWYGTDSNYEVYKADYIKLYVEAVRNATTSLDISRPFLVSSPSNGIESEQAGYVADNPADVRYGDVHYYNYYDNGWKWETFQKSRFTSEYGFQSWPSLRTFSAALDPSDYDINSPLMEHRQHHPNGQAEIVEQLSAHMIFNSSTTSFEHYLYMTQINQAMSMKTETEHLRRMRNTLDDTDQGNSMGALYWQLNDIWQGASWAGIEYGGRWKMLQYYVGNFFFPIIVSPYVQETELKINVVSDLTSNLAELTLTTKLYNYTSFDPLIEKTSTVAAPHLQSTFVAAYDLEIDFQISALCGGISPRNNCFFVVSLEDSGTAVAPSNTLLLGEPKDAPLDKATITVASLTQEGEGIFDIALNSDSIALFVWLETDLDGVFSENGFLIHEPQTVISFFARETVTVETLTNSLQITTLSDTYL